METIKLVNLTEKQYLDFCKKVEEANYFEYDETNLKREEFGLMYTATFRDESNYKYQFLIRFNDGEITWGYPKIYDYDDFEGLEDHFEGIMEEVSSLFV